MTKKETAKFIAQIIVSIASAILTALGATSAGCHVVHELLEIPRLRSG